MSGPREANDDIKKLIDDKLTAYAQAMNTKDVTSLVDLFSDTGVWLPPILPPIIGKAQITEALKNVLAGADVGSTMDFDTLGTFTDENAGNNPTIVYSYGKIDGRLPIKDGEVTYLPQKYLIVFHLINDDWKLGIVCFNFSGELPTSMVTLLRDCGSE